MDWLKFFVLVLTGLFAVYQYAMVRSLLGRENAEFPEFVEPSGLDTIVYVLLLAADLTATAIYALRFQSGGIANGAAWATVFCLGVCLAIAIWWIIPFRGSLSDSPTIDFPVPGPVLQTLRWVQLVSVVFFIIGFLALCVSVSST